MNNEIEYSSNWFVTLIRTLGPFLCNISRIIQKLKVKFQQEDEKGPKKNVNLDGTLGLGSALHKKM